MTTWYRRDASFNRTGRAQPSPTLLHLSCDGDRFGFARCAPAGNRRIILLTDDDRVAESVDDPDMWRCCKRCWWIHEKEMQAVALDYADAQLVISLLTSMDDCEDERVKQQALSIERRMRRIWPARKLAGDIRQGISVIRPSSN